MELADEAVVVFGNPRGGTPRMQEDPKIGIELPLRILVRNDGEQTHACFASQGYNLEAPTDQCYLHSRGDLRGLPHPLLAASLDTAGATPVAALLPQSPAVDGGDPAGCSAPDGSALLTDQIGTPRPQGPTCDIGAFELPQSQRPRKPCRVRVPTDQATLARGLIVSDVVCSRRVIATTSGVLFVASRFGGVQVAPEHSFALTPRTQTINSGSRQRLVLRVAQVAAATVRRASRMHAGVTIAVEFLARQTTGAQSTTTAIAPVTA
jgi:hypothetical protein